jgi:hypothetical protein
MAPLLPLLRGRTLRLASLWLLSWRGWWSRSGRQQTRGMPLRPLMRTSRRRRRAGSVAARGLSWRVGWRRRQRREPTT